MMNYGDHGSIYVILAVGVVGVVVVGSGVRCRIVVGVGGVGAGSARTSSSQIDVVGNAVVVCVNPYLNSVDGLILEASVLLSAVVVGQRWM